MGSDRTRRNTNLEIFVLAAVRAGLDSAYDLKKNSDLSVSATIPLLGRLEEQGMLSSKVAARRSTQYSLTARGRSVLNRSWKQLLIEVPKEFEAVLRIAYMAAFMERSLGDARAFLRKAAAERRELAKQREREAQSVLAEPDRQAFGSGHRWLRAHADSIRLAVEATLLFGLAGRSDLADVLSVRGE